MNKKFRCVKKDGDASLYLIDDNEMELICGGFEEGKEYWMNELDISDQFFQYIGDSWGAGFTAKVAELKEA